MNQLPQRRRPAQGVQVDLSQPIIVFLTVCTKNRRSCLANPGVHFALRQTWAEATAWRVGRYVLMPNHAHLFVSPSETTVPLENWVKYWKSTLWHHLPSERIDWQAGFWDRRLRRDESYQEKWDYVIRNPVRQGLVAEPKQWSFQGEIHSLVW